MKDGYNYAKLPVEPLMLLLLFAYVFFFPKYFIKLKWKVFHSHTKGCQHLINYGIKLAIFNLKLKHDLKQDDKILISRK